MVGMVINLIVGVYIPIIRIPIQGGMTIPNKRSLDCGTIWSLVLKRLKILCNIIGMNGKVIFFKILS